MVIPNSAPTWIAPAMKNSKLHSNGIKIATTELPHAYPRNTVKNTVTDARIGVIGNANHHNVPRNPRSPFRATTWYVAMPPTMAKVSEYNPSASFHLVVNLTRSYPWRPLLNAKDVITNRVCETSPIYR